MQLEGPWALLVPPTPVSTTAPDPGNPWCGGGCSTDQWGSSVPLTPDPGCLSGLGSSEGHVGAWKRAYPVWREYGVGRQGSMSPEDEVIMRRFC